MTCPKLTDCSIKHDPMDRRHVYSATAIPVYTAQLLKYCVFDLAHDMGWGGGRIWRVVLSSVWNNYPCMRESSTACFVIIRECVTILITCGVPGGFYQFLGMESYHRFLQRQGFSGTRPWARRPKQSKRRACVRFRRD